jgi:SAM-dependent methyltransferase
VTVYDEVPYTGRAYADTHPGRLATMAALFGVQAAPVEHCRVLEIGCGDAANLIPLAYALPGSEFTGFDLAAQPIAAGRQLAERIGLQNLALSQYDLADFPAESGEFDYIIAHGLYSWIPAAARDALLALIGRHLAPRGIAFVSYNTYPGCYLRRMAWEMLRFHVEPLEAPAERIAEAQAFARLLASGRTVGAADASLMKAELDRIATREGGFLFHDDLAEINDPVYFHEFVTHAEQHRLQFLCEAELVAMGYAGLSAEARHALDALDPLSREQYLDFLKCRRFRQSLLCREEVQVDRAVGPARIAKFQVSSRRRGQAGEPDASSPLPAEEALPRAMLDALEEALPGGLTIEQLAERLPGTDATTLRDLAWAAAQAGAVQLHVHVPRSVAKAGVHPLASPVARAQLEHGDSVTNLRHATVKLDDALARQLVALLDGTRDRAMLAAALGKSPDEIDARLHQLAKLALLVG